MEQREFEPKDLLDYLQFFKQSEHDRIIDEIIDSSKLKEFLAKPEGRLIATSLIKDIKDRAKVAMQALIEGHTDSDFYRDSAMKMRGSYIALLGIAGIIETGEYHIGEIKRVKRKKAA